MASLGAGKLWEASWLFNRPGTVHQPGAVTGFRASAFDMIGDGMPYDNKQFTTLVATKYAALLGENISHVRRHCDDEENIKKAVSSGGWRIVKEFAEYKSSVDLRIEDQNLVDPDGVAAGIGQSFANRVIEAVTEYETDNDGEWHQHSDLWVLHKRIPVNIGAGGALISFATVDGVGVLGQVVSTAAKPNEFEAIARWALATGAGAVAA
jgi:hypothetical protein